MWHYVRTYVRSRPHCPVPPFLAPHNIIDIRSYVFDTTFKLNHIA